MDRNTFLKKIKMGIFQNDPDAEIFLFGSRARGESNSDSDWDFLVISKKNKITFDIEKKFRDPIFDIELDTGEVVSLLIYTKKDWETKQNISPLFYNVKKEGIKL